MALWKAVLDRLDYQGHADILKTHGRWKNVMTWVERVLGHECVVVTALERGGFNRALWPKQKSLNWIEDPVAAFSKGQLVVEWCAGTF